MDEKAYGMLLLVAELQREKIGLVFKNATFQKGGLDLLIPGPDRWR